MTHPKQLGTAADEARQRLANMRKGGSNAPNDAAPVENAQPVKTDTATPAIEQTTAAPSETVRVEPAAQSKSNVIDPEDYKSRYNTLRNKRDERTTALEQENQSLKAQVARLTTQIEQAQPPVDNSFKLNDDQKEILGETEADVLTQMGKHLDSRLDKLEQKDQDTVKTLKDQFFEDLTSLVPDWAVFNNDAAFNNWLDTVDAQIGLLNRDLLDMAVNKNDATAASKVFSRFFDSGNSSKSQSASSDTSVIDPATSRQTASDDNDMVEIWSFDEVADFYDEKTKLYRQGKLVGKKAEEIAATEARIVTARREGRVRRN